MGLYYGIIVGICSTYSISQRSLVESFCYRFENVISKISITHCFLPYSLYYSPLYASVITLYDHSIQQLHHPLQHPEELPATDEPRPFLFSPVPMIHLSAVSSSSSLSSTATSKEKEL